MDHKELTEEQVFDSLMQEMLTGQHPPDLSARILAAISAEVGSDLNPSGKPASSNASNSSTVSSKLTGRMIGWLVAIAASALIGVATWQWLSREENAAVHGSNNLANSQPGVPTVTESPDSKIVKSAEANKNSAISKAQPADGDRRSKETIDSLPFDLDSNLANQNKPKSEVTATPQATKLTSEQIVEQLNQQLASMWQSMDVTPKATLSPEELAQQISKTLTGQQLSESELLQVMDDKRQSLNTSVLLARVTKSNAFLQSLSGRIVQQWTGRSASAADKILVQSLADRLKSEPRWNEIVGELIGGELENPESLSNQFLSLFAGGENHRLVECVGREFLNEQITCLRCHRRNDGENNLKNQQIAYWSLVAMVKGIEGRGAGQPVNDRQPELFANNDPKKSEPSVYFELPTGALKQAYATLPDGQSWKAKSQSSPRRALGEWIKESKQLDQATVNTVWQLVFGRPLMPRNVSVDAVALEHRAQMLEFLAEQFDLADHDMSQLVGWIVSSRAFSLRPNNLTRDQWQSMEQNQIDQWQLADWTFATGVQTQPQPARRRLQDNLKYVVNWRTDGKPQPVLSQPSPDLSANKIGLNSLKANRPTFSTSFAVHGLRHTVAEESYIDQLLKSSKLTWQERVQHVVGLNQGMNVGDDIQFSAKELLQQHSGDARAALLDLLWATQSSSF